MVWGSVTRGEAFPALQAAQGSGDAAPDKLGEGEEGVM